MPRRFSRTLINLFVVLIWLLQGFVIAAPVSAQAPREKYNSSYPCNGIIFDFVAGDQGWKAKQNSPLFGKVRVGEAEVPESPAGKSGLSLDLNLSRSHPSEEFWVDLQDTPPNCAMGSSIDVPLWEPGSVLSVWVWAPKGTRGDDVLANGIHLFAIDEDGRELYGTWQNFQEETWFEVTLNLDGGTPACGELDSGFKFSHIKKFGINISVNKDVNYPIKDKTISISPVSIKSGQLPIPVSDHLYSLDESFADHEHPLWKPLNKEWTADAITDYERQDGALLLNTDFTMTDSGRKAVMGLIYSPPLNLSTLDLDQGRFSVDIKFDPPPDFRKNNCPFVMKLWASDKVQNITFGSDNQNVGYDGWTRVSYHLKGFTVLDTNARKTLGEKQLDLSQISQVGFQIYGNAEYHGKIWIDNITIGGATPVQKTQPLSFVKTDGPHFVLDNQRFRFIGANAEYLPVKPDSVVEDVLNHAQQLGIRVIRIWGFGDGCEDYYQSSCENWSRYFQPVPGVYNASAFEHFDRIVYEAGKRNIRLIIPLANNWGEYGGIPRYICWSQGIDADCPGNLMPDELHDKFYTDETIKNWYRQYIDYFVNHENTITGIRYSEDPTIMAWELINEPRAKSDPSGGILHDWIEEMSGYLAERVPNQLIGTGEEGWYIMPQEEAYKFQDWQDFEKNYWHYGVNWKSDPSCTETWGSNGTDFLSDHSSDLRTVTWQDETYFDKSLDKVISSQKRSDDRVAIPEVDFTGIHLYPAPDGTGLAKAPYCEYYGLESLCLSPELQAYSSQAHQSEEWIEQHVKDSHEELNKPFILEEFNFSDLTKIIPGKKLEYQNVLVSADERARLFSQYLDFAYNMDVDGVMFWNLGYDGFNHQPWSELSELQEWVSLTDKTVSLGNPRGVQLDYGTDPSTKTTMTLFDPQVEWFRADGSQVFVEIDNDGGARNVFIEVEFSDGFKFQSGNFPLVSGQNLIDLTELFTVDLDAEIENAGSSEISCSEAKKEYPEITKVSITVQDYQSPGKSFFNFETIFNSKYVISPDDPVNEVIELASQRWQQDTVIEKQSVKIDHSLTCDTRIHPDLFDGTLPIQFDFAGGLEHPDGYYYRYFVDGPNDNDVFGFGATAMNQSNQILIEAPAIGKYRVSIAPEGVNFDDRDAGADFCYFNINNTAPRLTFNEIQVDGRVYQPPYETVKAGFSLFRIKREIEISISGEDEVSADLQLGCILLKNNQQIDPNLFSCPLQLAATTQKGDMGRPDVIHGVLPPGRYELQLTASDGESATSDMILDIVVFDSRYIFLLVLLVITVVMVMMRRSRKTRLGI